MGATLVTFGPGNSGGQIGLMLKEIQVPPCFLSRVVGFKAILITFWAAKGAPSWKIKADVQTLFNRVKFSC
ncbi:hypothetical protein DSCOOX_12660 [Desulfosarcina ovata subsp. ovata]|uniref:Uncharacterized protein n=1 Tax=Desulfosarcina ovata subsp. ovata TaxID=2752305 RepID=A0A5K8A6L1_9BACT|nr:hypothetical protein DSCOOX_12660 [Desulfosarcina ovata subsp. ovata]